MAIIIYFTYYSSTSNCYYCTFRFFTSTHCQNSTLINPESHAYIICYTVYTVCISLSTSGWLPPYSFKSSIKSKWFNLLFPLPKLYPCFVLRNTSVNGRRDTRNSTDDNNSPCKIPRFIFTAPRSVLLKIKFVFQFFIVSFSKFTIFLAAPTSSSQFIIHEWDTMS